MTETQIQKLERQVSELTELVSTQAQVISDHSRDNNRLMSENTRLKMILYRILQDDFHKQISTGALFNIEHSDVTLDDDKYVVMLNPEGSVLAEKYF